MEVAESITSLNVLIERLEESDPADFPSILKQMDIDPSDFDKFKTWKEDDYTRNCIVRSKNFELILLCWNQGNKTPIHSHDGQKCWVYQVEGIVDEVRYQKGENENLAVVHKQSLSPGSLTYMDDRMGYHTLENHSNGRASTLHLYMLPIEHCEYFCEEEGDFKEKKLTYDTQSGH